MRVPAVIRWPGHIKPGTVFNDIFASYDWLPTFVEIAVGPKGNDLNKQIMEGKYPGIVKTMLSGGQPARLPDRQVTEIGTG
jgi:arylsulfatase